MWRFDAGLLCGLCVVATMILQFCTLASGNLSKYGQDCNINDLTIGCGLNERCMPNQNNGGKCVCLREYEYINQECTKVHLTEPPTVDANTMKPDSNSNGAGKGNSVAAILLIPTCLVIIGALVYFGARRYKWIQQFRQFRQNRYGSVLVRRDDTDDDDPPLA